jgi:hypothetical protein
MSNRVMKAMRNSSLAKDYSINLPDNRLYLSVLFVNIS